MIDTHSHLNFDVFKKDYKQIIEDCIKREISIINVGVNYESSLRAVKIAEEYKKGIYASIGLHPLYVENEEYNCKKYLNLAKNSKKVIAIGEVGLDYSHKTKINFRKIEKKQKEVLSQQISLAQKINLPIIFHCRKAHKDLIDILEENRERNRAISGVIHCFTGNVTDLKNYMELGLFLGLNGIIFKMKSKIIKKIPLEKILFETDCPYLTPPPLGNIRNKPQFMIETIKKVAGIKEVSLNNLIKIADKNSKKLFKI